MRGHGKHAESAADATPKVSFIAPIKGAVLGGVAATWLQAVATSALLIAIGVAMDDLLAGGALSTTMLATLAGIVVVRAGIAAAVPLVGIDAAGRLEAWGRSTAYQHLLRLGAPLRSQARTGKLVSTTTEAVELSSFYHATFLGPIIASMTVPILVVVAIALFIDGWSALWLFLAIPIIPGMVHGFQSRFQAVSDIFRETANGLSARFLDALQGLPTLKLFNRGTDHGAQLEDAAEGLRRAIMRLLLGNQIVLLVVDAAFSLGMITLAGGLAMVRFRSGAISAGEAIALVLLALQLTEPLDKVGQFFYVGMGGMAATKEVRALLADEPTVPDNRDAPSPGDVDPTIVFEDVRLSFGEVEVLRGVDLTIPAGSTVALVGPSGAGKTTIANILQRNLAVDAGRVTLGGADLDVVPAAWVRDQITVVAQSPYLFTGTLRDNLLVARPEAGDDDLWAALAGANLESFVRALPDGLDTAVGERALTLSGGQAQRLSIARALLKDAPVVVLDEPTSAVDLESEAAILAALDRLTEGRTVLVIAHRLSTVRDADQIVVLDAGQVVEQGRHDELVARGGHYADAVASTTREVPA